MITTVEVERFSLTSSQPFDKILAAIKAARGHPDMVEFAKRTAAAAGFPEFESIVREGLGKTGLMLFMELDHGAVIRKAMGRDKPRMVRLIMGHPLIMQQMARHVPDAGSYAPVTVLVDERSEGVHISYDRMASLLASYGSSDALAVARGLDKKVETLLSEAIIAGTRIRENTLPNSEPFGLFIRPKNQRGTTPFADKGRFSGRERRSGYWIYHESSRRYAHQTGDLPPEVYRSPTPGFSGALSA